MSVGNFKIMFYFKMAALKPKLEGSILRFILKFGLLLRRIKFGPHTKQKIKFPIQLVECFNIFCLKKRGGVPSKPSIYLTGEDRWNVLARLPAAYRSRHSLLANYFALIVLLALTRWVNSNGKMAVQCSVGVI